MKRKWNITYILYYWTKWQTEKKKVIIVTANSVQTAIEKFTDKYKMPLQAITKIEAIGK